MITTLSMAGIFGVGVASVVKDLIHDPNKTLEGRIQLIMKRCDICSETKESNDKKRKLYPTLVKQGWNGKNKVFYYKLPVGLSYLDVYNKLPYFWDGLGAEVILKKLEGDFKSDFTMTVLSGHLPDSISFDLETIMKIIQHKKGQIILPIGYSRRKFETVEISSDMFPTILIAGTIGSGKSTIIRLMQVALHLGYTPEEVGLWIADLKEGIEGNVLGDSNFIDEKVSSPWESGKFFQNLLKLTQERYRILSEANCTDITQYNEENPNKFMKRLILFIDEYAMLEGGKGDTDENKYLQGCRTLVKQIVAIGRACGVHTILATQRPSHEVIEGTLKNNLAVTIGFRTKNETSSRIVMDGENKLAHIDPDKPGRCILRTDRDVFVQVPLIKSNEAKSLLLPYQKTKNSQSTSTVELKKSTKKHLSK